MTTTTAAGRLTHSWRTAFGLARYELAVSARMPVLWVVPALWVLLLILQIQGADLRLSLQSVGGAGFIPGFFAAAMAVTLPARTRAAGAPDIVGVMPWQQCAAAGRMLAAAAAGTVMVVVAPVGAAIFALVTGHSTVGFADPLGMYFVLLLPAAWVGSGLGLLAGQAILDTRLAMLSVFVGGALGFVVAQAGSLALWPFGAFDLATDSEIAPAVPWPFGGLLPWHVLTLVGVAGLVGAAARRVAGESRAARLMAVGAGGLLLVGFIGYQTALAPIQVGPGPRAAQPSLPWTVQRMKVTLDLGDRTTGTAAMVLQNAGTSPLTEVSLHMPAGLHVVAAHWDRGSLVPGQVLRLPSAVPAGATVDLIVSYGGHWTGFANRTATALVRALGPTHVVLQAYGGMGWAPHPEVGGGYPLSLRLTGRVPAETFCNLPPTAPHTWSGHAGNIQCIGANLRESQDGSLVMWAAQQPQSLHLRSVTRALSDAARCLGVSGAAIGAIAIPVTSTGWIEAFAFQRYGDPEMVAPVPRPFGPNLGFLVEEEGAQAAWGPGGTAAVAGDPSLRAALIRLLQGVVDRELLVPEFGNAAMIASSPGGKEVEAAMAGISTGAGCRLLGALHALDVSGKLTDAAVAQVVAGAEGGRA